jgi:hypothetical protein
VTDQRIEKWTRWIEGPTIRVDVLTMNLQREAWREVSRIIHDHGELPDSYWWAFMLDTYITTQAVAVRRQADTHPDVASLAKLLEELSDDAGRVTRDFWIDLWRDDDGQIDAMDLRFAEQQWAENYGSGDTLDPAIPTHDVAVLKASAASVKSFVDKHIAHAEAHPVEQAPPDAVLKVSDVHDAIDVIGDVFKRYSTLFTAGGYVSLVAEIQHDWKAIFREPWIKPRAPRRTGL